MKKLTILLLAVIIYGCKKTDIQPQQSVQAPATNYETFNSGVLTLKVESNYKYSYAAIEVDTFTIKRINESVNYYTTPTPFDYSFFCKKGTYRIYVSSASLAKYKWDNVPTWHKVSIYYRDTILIKQTTDNHAEIYFNVN